MSKQTKELRKKIAKLKRRYAALNEGLHAVVANLGTVAAWLEEERNARKGCKQ